VPDEIPEVVVFQAAQLHVTVRMREDEDLQLLRPAQYRTKPRVGELLVLDGAAELDGTKTVVLDDALQLGDRGVRMLHGYRPHPHEALRKARRHRRDAVVDEARGLQGDIEARPVEEDERGRGYEGNIDAFAIHARHLGRRIVELGENGQGRSVIANETRPPGVLLVLHLIVLGVAFERGEHFGRYYMAVHVDALRFPSFRLACRHVPRFSCKFSWVLLAPASRRCLILS